jgi:hypothetical protein
LLVLDFSGNESLSVASPAAILNALAAIKSYRKRQKSTLQTRSRLRPPSRYLSVSSPLLPGHWPFSLLATDNPINISDFAMSHISHVTDGLTSLPTEILLDIFQGLDLQSISELSLTCKQLHDVFTRRKSTIILPVLMREYSPLDELLQVCTATSDDILNGQSLYVPRRIIYKRDVGDSGIVLATGGGSKSNANFTRVSKGGKPGQHFLPNTATTVLTEKNLDSILKHCRMVRSWEGLFPQMRWFHEPENCRMLRAHESERFRKALYRWWLYSIHFHGDSPRPRIGLPADYVEDVRTSQLRYHSTSELLELMDLMAAVKDVVFHYICPRLDPTHGDVGTAAHFFFYFLTLLSQLPNNGT